MAKKKTEYPLVRAIDGDRKQGAFSNVVMNYRYEIRTSARCSGMKSNGTYTSRGGAEDAGKRALENIFNHMKLKE